MAKETFSFEEAVAPAKVFSFEEALGEPAATNAPATEPEVVTSARPWQGAGAGRGGLNDPRRLDVERPPESFERPGFAEGFTKGLTESERPLGPGGVLLRAADALTGGFAQERFNKANQSVLDDKTDPALAGEFAKPAMPKPKTPVLQPRTDTISPTGGVVDALAGVPANTARSLGSTVLNFGALAAELGLTIQSPEQFRRAAADLDKTKARTGLGVSDEPLARTGTALDALIPSAKTLADYAPEGIKQLGMMTVMGPGAIIADAGARGVNQAREEGLGIVPSVLYGAGQAASEGVPEAFSAKFAIEAAKRIPLAQALRGDAKAVTTAFQQTAQTMGVELGSEQVSALGNWVVDKIAADPTATPDRLVADMKEAVKATIVQGPTMLAGAKLMQSAATGLAPRPEDQAARELARELNRGNLPPGTVETLNPNLSQPAITPKTLAGLTEIGAAASVDEAIIAAARATTPQAQAVDNIGRLLGDSANVSQPGNIPPVDSGAAGAGAPEPGIRVEAGVGASGAAGPALDAGGVRDQPAGGAAPLAAGRDAELTPDIAETTRQIQELERAPESKPGQETRGEPASVWFGRRGDGYQTPEDAQSALPTRTRISPELDWRVEQMPTGRYRLAGYDTETRAPTFTVRMNPTGTATVLGNPKAIAAKLAEAGITKVAPNRDGVTVATSQAQAAAQFLGGGEAAARTDAASAAIKPVAPPANPPTQAQAGLPAEGAGESRPAPAAAPEQVGPYGRDLTPIAQGGKPFKTKAQADAFRKANTNNMRTVKQGAGFVLRDLTAKELAAREKAAKRLAQASTSPAGVPIPAHAFIADKGGLAQSAMADSGFDRNMKVGNRWLFAGTGKPGLTLAEAAELLAEAGYIREESEAAAADIIKRSMTSPQYTADGWERIAEAEQAARFEDHLAAQQDTATEEDPFGPAPAFTPAEIMVVPKSVREEYAALMAAAEEAGIDTESVLEEAARVGENWTQEQYNEYVRQALTDAIANSRREADRGESAVQGREDAERSGTESSSSNTGRPGDAPSQADEGLTTRSGIIQPQEQAQPAPALREPLSNQEQKDNEPALTEPAETDRYAAGKALTKEQRKQVLGTLVDVYKAKDAPREQKGIGPSGNERYGYVHSPELFEKSDITGAMVRYYVTLPDGRIAHPSELFPDFTQAQIDTALIEQANEERREKEGQAFAERQADSGARASPAEADAAFMQRNRGFELRDWRTGKTRSFVHYEKDGRYYSVLNDDDAMMRRVEKAGWTRTDTLTAPTQQDVLAQQDRRDNADELDQREQIQREASGFQLQAQAPERRRDNTGDMFGGPTAEDVARARDGKREADAVAQAARDAESGQGGLFASEPTTDYTGGYETDLFGEPLPAPRGNDRAARPAGAGVRGDAQPASTLQDTPAPRAEYYVNTFVGSPFSREIGASRVTTPEQAAQATRYLYRSAVERFDGIVTDKDGKPLAIVGGFKGAVSQASVYPATVMGEAVRIPGAAHIWFSHNHPSGTANLSTADERLNMALSDVFKGSGIEPMGLLAIAGDRFAYVDQYGSPSSAKTIPEATTKKSIPVIERELGDGTPQDAITTPGIAKQVAAVFYKKASEPGVMLLNSQNAVAGWFPITPAMMGPLRGTGGLNAIYRAVSQSNAASAIIVHGGELDYAGIGDYSAKVTPSENIAAALAKIDVRPLDSVNVVTNKSVAEQGREVAKGPLFSRAWRSDLREKASQGLPLFRKGADQTTGLTPTQFTQALSKAFGAKVADRLQAKGVVVPLADQTKLPAHVVPFLRDGDIVFGFYDPRTDRTYAVLENLTPDMVKGLALHEVGVHYGFEAMLGADKYKQVMKQLDLMRKSGNVAVQAAYDQAQANAARPSQIPEETLAYLVQEAPNNSVIKDVIARIKAWLFREFGIGGKYLTERDLHMLARAAVQHAARTEPGGVEVPAFMRQNEGMANRKGKGAPTPDTSLKQGRPDAGMQERPTVRAVSGSLGEPAQSGGGAGSGVNRSTIAKAEQAAIKAANAEMETVNRRAIDEEMRSIQINGNGADIEEIANNPKFWNAEDEELTPEGYAEYERQNLELAKERAGVGLIEDLSDLNGKDQTAQAEAFAAYADALGLSVRKSYSSGGSRYVEVGIGDADYKFRFADHFTTVRDTTMQPDFNVAPGRNDFTEAFDYLLSKLNESPAPTPDGAPESSRTPQTETKAFKDWFGDSKVVDAEGKPLIVYHGTTADLSAFDLAFSGSDGVAYDRPAIFATDDARVASDYARNKFNRRIADAGRAFQRYKNENPGDYGEEYEKLFQAYRVAGQKEGWDAGSGANVLPLYLSIQNPLEVDGRGERFMQVLPDAVKRATDLGKDGVIARNVIDHASPASEYPVTVYIAFAPEQVKSATGNNGNFDPKDPDIRFSRTNAAQTENADPTPPELSPWRDATGRLQFAPGAWLWDKLGTASGPILNKLQLKAATPELRRIMRQMKLDVAKAQEVAAAVAGEATKLTEDERAMVSDLIEKELKAGTVPPEHAVRLAAMINSSMEQQTNELVRLGMLTKDSADRWRGQYLPRYYESKLTEKAGDLWADAMRSITRRPSAMKGIKGKHLRGRGLYETIPESQLEDYKTMGWEVRDPDYQPGVTTDGTVQVWRDFTRQERDKMGEIRDAGFRFVMGYMQTQKDIALGKMFEQLAIDPEMSSRLETEKFSVRVPDGTAPGTEVKTYGKLAGRYVSPETLSQLSLIEESQSEALMMYRKALGIWKEGKALALDTPIPTPSGWTTMGALQPGDQVFDEKGRPCEVTFATPVQMDRECFEVEFSDGCKIVADAEHLWLTKYHGVESVKTTKRILETLKYAGGQYNAHSVPVAGPLTLPDQTLPIDPYYLGVWLGNGTARNTAITSCQADGEVIMGFLRDRGLGIGAVRKDPRGDCITYSVGFDGYRPRRELLQPTMRALNLLQNKHIPAIYLRASEQQRLDLLCGLMDTDGTISERGQLEFCTTTEALKDGIVELARSLGFKPRARKQTAAGNNQVSWLVKFHGYDDRPVFALPRKIARLRKAPETRQRSSTRQIVAITPVASVPVKCIQVSSESRLYLAGEGMIPTHNTVLNPVSHVNNTISNMSMAHFAGVSYGRADKYLAAMRDFARKDSMILEAKDNGLFLGTLSEAELMNTLPEDLKALAQKQEGTAEKVGRTTFNLMTFYLRRPMGWAYQAEDTFFRYLIYKDARGRGMEPQDAVDYAQRYIFTYDDLPKTARRIRDFGIPFFAYTYKAVPALLHTALTHPERLAAPAAVLWTINAAAYAIAAGDDEDDWDVKLRRYLTDPEYREKARAKEKLERELLPEWNKGTTSLMTPKVIRLGNDELTKLPLFIDVSRIIPGGDLFDVNPNAGGIGLPQPITPSHPLFTTAVAMLANKDLFFGKDLTDSNDTAGEKFDKRAAWMWKQLTPAITVNNYHFERGMNALAQAAGGEVKYVPDFLGGDATGIGRDGLPVQPKLAAMQTFGIKVRPYDLDAAESIQESAKQKLIRDIDTELRKLRRLENKGAVSDRTAEKERELANLKKDRLRDGKTVDGEDR